MICLGIVVASYFIHSVVISATRAGYQRQARISGIPAFPAIQQTAPALPVAAPMHYLVGQYSGRAIVPARGVCALKFEIRVNPEKPGTFSGYSTLICTPVIRQWRPAASLMLAAQPTSAILTGIAENGAVRFHVDDTVAGNCAPTAFTVKPFGTSQIALQWQDACGGGKMLLDRAAR